MQTLLVKSYLGDRASLVPYESALVAMRDFTRNRSADSQDELWILEHEPVYTLGQAASAEHIFASANVPVVRTDRGGEVTYHGPGQLMLYFLADISRLKLTVRSCVVKLEAVIIRVLKKYGVDSRGDRDAPGVYVGQKKIASIGLRFSRGKCYHGMGLNYDATLEAFSHINPCGYAGLSMTQISDCCAPIPSKEKLVKALSEAFEEEFGYRSATRTQSDWTVR